MTVTPSRLAAWIKRQPVLVHQPTVVALHQVAEHKRAVDKILEDKRAMYEAARAAEEQEAAAR
jgi:hypothetical protein